MNQRQMQFAVGLVVFATMIIGGLLATVNSPIPSGLVPWGQSTYRVTIELQEAPGVGPDTPVRKSGLLIGRVASIEDLDDRILVHANIEEGRRLFAQYGCQVRTSVLGDATIDFVTKPIPPGAQPLADGAVVPGEVVGNPLDMLTNLQGDLKVTIDALGRAGNEVANLAARVNTAFGSETEEGRVDRLLQKTELALDRFAQASDSANQLFGDEEVRARLKQSMADLPDTLREMRSSFQKFDSVMESADRNFKNLEGFTEPIGRNGETIASSIVEAVDGLGKLVDEFTVLTQALNSREGTLGQLIHDPKLYDNVNGLVINANQVVCQIHELSLRLRPIVEDVRVFTDKIAREPGRLVTGGLSPSLQK